MRVALTILLVASVLACIPALHQILGMQTFDAFDEGVLAPKSTGGSTGIALLLGLLFAAYLLALGSSHLQGVFVVPAGVRVPSRHRIAHRVHTQAPRRVSSEDAGDDHLGGTYPGTTPTLGRASS